jgi:hypothetical protein
VPVLAFWDLTPRETYMTIEAAVWRDERQQRQIIAQAWGTAALTRAKRLPGLRQLLAGPGKALKGRELEKREQEFEELSAGVDVKTLGQRLRPGKKQHGSR